MACYKLARFYHCHPNEFLNEPLSWVVYHLDMTHKLMEAIKPQDEDDG